MTSISKSFLARAIATVALAAPALSFATAPVANIDLRVPEPGSLALVGLGLAVAVAVARRRK